MGTWGSLATLSDLDRAEVRETLIAAGLDINHPDAEDWVDAIGDLARMAEEPAGAQRRRYAVMPAEQLAGELAKRARHAKDQSFEALCVELSIPRPAPPGSGRWPTRSAKQAARMSGATLEEAEQALRNKAVDRLIALLKEIGAPVVRTLTEGRSDRLRYLAQGRRANTLKQRVRVGEAMRRWLMTVRGRPWLRGCDDLIEYLECRAGEPCGRTVPRTIVDTVALLEELGHFPLHSRFAHHPLCQGAVTEITQKLVSTSGVRLKRKAKMVPVMLIIAWEDAVSASGLPRFVRHIAWLHLIMVWAALRFDDCRWCDVTSARLQSWALLLSLTRTKTTGPGKKIEMLEAVISRDAWLKHSDWLVDGLRNAQELWEGAPFMWPLPSASLDDAVRGGAKYADAAACSLALADALGADEHRLVEEPGCGATRKCPLFAPGMAAFWTLHSPRNWLPSVAAAMKKSNELIGRLGRWGQDVREAYVRATRQIVMDFQQEAACRLRQRGRDFLGEAHVLSDFERYCLDQGYEDEEVAMTVQRLRFFDQEAGVTQEESTAQPPPQASPEAPPCSGDESDKDSDAENANTEVGGYVVSITGKRTWRRLHYIGRCWRRPGKDYASFQTFGEDAPPAAAYDAVCRDCWKVGDLSLEFEEADEATGSSTSDEDPAGGASPPPGG